MKKLFFLLIITFWISPQNSFSQISLSKNNVPKKDHKYIYIEANWSNSIEKGEDINWDFRNLQTTGNTLEKVYTTDTTYESFSNTSCYSQYPSSTDSTLLRSYKEIYSFTDSNFVLKYRRPYVHHGGSSGFEKSCIKEANHTLLKFPFKINDKVSENWSYGDGKGTNTVEVIAYGTLQLPDTTYYNTLLVYRNFHSQAYNLPAGNHITNFTYSNSTWNWYTEESEVPVFIASSDWKHENYYSNGGNHYNTKKSLIYREKKQTLTTVKELSLFDDIVLYPNPVENTLHIKQNTPKNQQIIIVNSLGQVVLKMPIQSVNNSVTIDTSSLLKGVYYIQFMSDSNIITKCFIKK